MKVFVFCVLLMIASAAKAQLLWQVSGRGIHTSYILGTHHLLSAALVDSVAGVYKAFNECKTIVSELAMNNNDTMQHIQMASLMPRGADWLHLLKSDTRLRMDTLLRRWLPFEPMLAARFKPSIIASMIEMERYKQCIGCNEEFMPMDSYFQHLAMQLDKPVIGLETVEQQMDVLTGNSIEWQVELLQQTLLDTDYCTVANRLTSQYVAGALDAIWDDYINDTSRYAPSQQDVERLIYSRNVAWVERLPTLMKQSACFVAVGALHLPGKQGVLQLLRKKGYKVKAVALRGEEFKVQRVHVVPVRSRPAHRYQ